MGDTDHFELNQIEMQGTVPAPLKCAVQVDTLGKYCYTYNTVGCVIPHLLSQIISASISFADL